MRKKIILLAYCFLALMSNQIKAQDFLSDSVLVLEGVEIETSAITENLAGFEIQKIDSLALATYQTSDLGRLLAYRTPIFLKFYSINGLATPSFRGTSAGHTQVFWQGIPLNSPTLGQVDFSLFPIGLLDEVSVHYGAASLRHGEGGFGGGISLENNINSFTRNTFNWTQSYGSFATMQQIVRASYSLDKQNKFRAITRLFFKTAQNDYPYQYLGREEIRERAASVQKGLVQELYYLPNDNHQFSVNFWYQDADRELPPPITIPVNKESQQDNSHRLVSSYSYHKSKLKIDIKTGLLLDELKYQNEIADISSDTKTESYHLIAEAKYAIRKNLLFQAAYRYRKDKAIIYQNVESEQKYEQKQQSIFTSLEYSLNQNIHIGTLLRQVWLNNKAQMLLPSLSLEINKKDLVIKASAARNLRIPTLNDRYWFPVGNPELRNEKGWNAEASLLHPLLRKDNWDIEIKGLYFWSRLENWILWSPAVAGYWRPENLRSVRSQGIESSLFTQFEKEKLSVEASISYTYTNTKNLEPIRGLDESAGKQLIYTPFHQQKSYLFASYKMFFVRAEQQYVSRRFTTTTNTQFLPDYFLTNFSIGKRFEQKSSYFVLEFSTQNAFDFQYQSMAFFPMPGRSFEFNLRLGVR